jgi:hypothetical protein
MMGTLVLTPHLFSRSLGRSTLAPLWCALLFMACSGPASPSALQTSATATCAGTPGVACFGRNNYIEYIPGDLPVVISVPHGGALVPATIPDRTVGTTVTDSNTVDLGRAISAAFMARSGRAPHVVLVHLRRTKLDANRDVAEGAAGNADAIQAWTEYHAFIEQATGAVRQRTTTGLYIDLHGHGHAPQRLELGYLLSASTLDGTAAQLDAPSVAAASSLRLLATTSPLPFSALLRGPTSLGGLLEPTVASVPSPSIPSPGTDEYFNGGYSTSRHSSSLPGLQIESHFNGVRDSAASRSAFADTLVRAVTTFAQTHMKLTW